MIEKRILKASFPNEWSYEFAEEVVRDYVQRNFVDKGMCADQAIYDGEKITPKQWKAEIQSLQSEYDSIGMKQTETATELAYAKVISYNRKNLERERQSV